MCQHWVQTKHQSLKSVAWCQFVDEHLCLTKPHRPPSPLSLAAFIHPHSLRVVKANQHLGGCLKWKRIWKMRRAINRQTCPKLSLLAGLYLAVSVFSWAYIQYIDPHITFTIREERKKRTHAPTLIHTHSYPHVSAFVSHTFTLNSLSSAHIQTMQGQSGAGGVI